MSILDEAAKHSQFFGDLRSGAVIPKKMLGNLECLQCGGRWRGDTRLGCRVCETHLYVHEFKEKKNNYRKKPVGMSDVRFRHECEVRYWVDLIRSRRLSESQVYENIKKRRGVNAADRLRVDILKVGNL